MRWLRDQWVMTLEFSIVDIAEDLVRKHVGQLEITLVRYSGYVW